MRGPFGVRIPIQNNTDSKAARARQGLYIFAMQISQISMRKMRVSRRGRVQQKCAASSALRLRLSGSHFQAGNCSRVELVSARPPSNVTFP
jgi:hypothetical protein